MTDTERAEIRLRTDTAAGWTAANPVLGPGEPGFESDTAKLKIGDGVTTWTGLAYFAAGGGGSSAIAQIGAVDLAAAASTIAFASIPGTYRNLRLIVTGRSSSAVANDTMRLYANGDTTAANYKNKPFYGSSGTSYTGSADSVVGFLPGTTATAGEPGSADIVLPHYAGTTFRKIFQSQHYSPTSPLNGVFNTMRLNTAAITDLTLTLLNGQFVAGTRATLYALA